MNKYVDGVSDLELYITNKLMNKVSTREIVDQLSKDIQKEGQDRNETVNHKYMTMTSAPPNKMFH